MYTTLILAILLELSSPVGGAKLDVSRSMIIVELDKANNVIRQAKESSQKALTKEEVAQMLEKAKEVLSGSMVQCTSYIMEK